MSICVRLDSDESDDKSADEMSDLEYHAVSPDLVPPVTGATRYFRRRLVSRGNGRSTVRHAHIARWTFGFVTDGFTTLINANWLVILLVFCAAYILSWLLFAALWAAVADWGYGGANNTCVVNVEDFTSAFLFSVEVETTIGFGSKYVSNDCHVGAFLLVLQSILGLVIDAVLLGLIFAKLTFPRHRRKSLIFSRTAVIRKVDGEWIFQCRVGDLRRSQLVECHIRLQLYWFRPDPGEGQSGETLGLRDKEMVFEQHDLDVGYDTGFDRVVLLTPVLITHPISPESPLHGLTPAQLQATDFEIVVILEGIVEATGLTAQALWSYTPEEVVFNEEFAPVVSRGATSGQWVVDFARIHDTSLVEEP